VTKDIYKSVLAFPWPAYRAVVPALAEKFKEGYGAQVTLFCNTKEEVEYYSSKHPGLFQQTYCGRFFYDILLAEGPADAKGVREEALALEAKYAFKFTHLMMDNRHVGLGFSPGGINFHRSIFALNAGYDKALYAFVRLFKFMERVFAENEITLVINPTKAASIIAEHVGIPQRTFISSRYKNYYYWAVNDVLASNLIEGAYRMADPNACAHQLDSPLQFYADWRRDATKFFSTSTFVKKAVLEVARKLYHRMRGYDKAQGYLLSEKLRARYRIWSQYRKIYRQRVYKLEEIRHLPYVYFPLAVEPERTLTRDSPEFSDQYFALLSIAKELPAGVFLAVKEHLPAIGPRPTDYYKAIRAITNVLFLDPMESGLNVVKHASAVGTVTGTAGLEAAVLGVPVISFNRHALYNIIPHVHCVTGWLQIGPVIKKIFDTWEADLGQRKNNGGRFLQAIVDISVDCKETRFHEAIDPAILDQMLALLDRTLLASDSLPIGFCDLSRVPDEI
jgi:hypothetical protein